MRALFYLALASSVLAHAGEHQFPNPLSRKLCVDALSSAYRPRMTPDVKAFGELILWISGQHPAYVRARGRASLAGAKQNVRQMPLGFSRPADALLGLARWLPAGKDRSGEVFRERIWREFIDGERVTEEFQTAATYVVHNVITILSELGDPANHRPGANADLRTVDLSYEIADPRETPKRSVEVCLTDLFTPGDLARITDLARVVRAPSIYPALYAGVCVHRDELAIGATVGEADTMAPPAGEAALERLGRLVSRFERRDAADDHRALALVNHVLIELTLNLKRSVDWESVARGTFGGSVWSAADHANLTDEDARVRAELQILRATPKILARAARWAAAQPDTPQGRLTTRTIEKTTAAVNNLIERRSADARVLDRALFLSSVVALRELFGANAIDEAAVDAVLAGVIATP